MKPKIVITHRPHPATACNVVNIIKANWSYGGTLIPVLLRWHIESSDNLPGEKTHTAVFEYDDGSIKALSNGWVIRRAAQPKPL